MHPDAQANLAALKREPNVTLVFTRELTPTRPRQRLLCATGPLRHYRRTFELDLDGAEIVRLETPQLRTLTTIPDAHSAAVDLTQCRREPIPAGFQISPGHGQWVGTLAGLVRLAAATGLDAFGFLTNWHVIPHSPINAPVPVHQPTPRWSAIGISSKAAEPKPGQTNLCDAATGSCAIDGHHTLAPEIAHLGTPAPHPIDLVVGSPVTKTGRTTGNTRGTVTAIHAAARVSYGNFAAEFADQDVITGHDMSFSAPGDSGSLVLHSPDLAPASLLFAGNGAITIASPMRHVTEALGLAWPIL